MNKRNVGIIGIVFAIVLLIMSFLSVEPSELAIYRSATAIVFLLSFYFQSRELPETKSHESKSNEDANTQQTTTSQQQ